MLSLPKINEERIMNTLEARFFANLSRHKDLDWVTVKDKLLLDKEAMKIIVRMEETGGEPDIVPLLGDKNYFAFVDCSLESPAGRRNTCYDDKALETRKTFKPLMSAMGMASKIGSDLLTLDEYHKLQTIGNFDTKTSSWLKTPSDIRGLGGALFGDFRYGQTFIYHNGAQLYYSSRGFRTIIRI